MSAPAHVVARLLANATRTADGCLLSNRRPGSHGYSQACWVSGDSGKKVVALGHRIAWEAARGPIPTDMTVDHICRQRLCIEPSHLRLLTNRDNGVDNSGGRTATAPIRLGRTCRQGSHELLLYASGAVACRECSARRTREKRARKTARRQGVDL